MISTITTANEAKKRIFLVRPLKAAAAPHAINPADTRFTSAATNDASLSPRTLIVNPAFRNINPTITYAAVPKSAKTAATTTVPGTLVAGGGVPYTGAGVPYGGAAVPYDAGGLR
ncbi:hypothetical protein C8E89_1642 [Mycolicibacterium moriokaense]|uniref:Uncharacterized protein n=1 Tax=Mycolicibacterium moriokaense TaxID=39691 RepID=A0A318GY71_9MYCO|nr:hypothetical protein C8E89_1642 [Mycolicibacterium moriokaense]